MEKISSEQSKDNNSSQWNMAGVEFAGNKEAEAVDGSNAVKELVRSKEAELEAMHREWRINQGLEAEDVDEDAGASAGESVAEGVVNVEVFGINENGDVAFESIEPTELDGAKNERWTAFVKGTAEADKLKQDESLMLFLTSADGGYAVKKEEAIDTFIEGVEKAEDGKDFYEAQRLGLTIQSEKGDFAKADVQKMMDFMQTPIYQKKLYEYNVEQGKKNIEKKTGDLQRCMDEVEREKKGGFFKRLLNRRAIKEAEGRAEMARKGIQDAEETVAFYMDKLKKLETDGRADDVAKLDTEQKAA